jgi:hypothetical protein
MSEPLSLAELAQLSVTELAEAVAFLPADKRAALWAFLAAEQPPPVK